VLKVELEIPETAKVFRSRQGSFPSKFHLIQVSLNDHFQKLQLWTLFHSVIISRTICRTLHHK